MNILLVILVSAAAIAITVLIACWQMNMVAERLVGNKHRAAEIIHRTGEVPDNWKKGYVGRIKRLKERGREQRAGLLCERAKQRYLERLSGLFGYIEQTPLIQDEEARAILLARLRDLRFQWENRKAEDFLK